MKKLDWNEKRILETIRLFIKEDTFKLLANSKVAKFDLELAQLASSAMIDLLCIKYHNEAKRNCENYTLTYEELCKRI